MSSAHAYIDESGTQGGSPVLCLAGYVFHHDEAVVFTKEWSALLRKYDLSNFHMVDCAHGNGEFKKLSKPTRVAALTEAIQLIKQRSAFGFATTVNEADYAEIFAPLSDDRWSAYYFCLNNCLSLIANWARRTRFDENVSYFFEAGHPDQGAADQRMHAIFADEKLRKRFFYGCHSFDDKRRFVPLQAADILAWQWFSHTKRKLAGAARDRLDFVALIRPQDMALTFDRERLIEARRHAIATSAGLLKG